MASLPFGCSVQDAQEANACKLRIIKLCRLLNERCLASQELLCSGEATHLCCSCLCALVEGPKDPVAIRLDLLLIGQFGIAILIVVFHVSVLLLLVLSALGDNTLQSHNLLLEVAVELLSCCQLSLELLLRLCFSLLL